MITKAILLVNSDMISSGHAVFLNPRPIYGARSAACHGGSRHIPHFQHHRAGARPGVSTACNYSHPQRTSRRAVATLLLTKVELEFGSDEMHTLTVVGEWLRSIEGTNRGCIETVIWRGLDDRTHRWEEMVTDCWKVPIEGRLVLDERTVGRSG